jgi:hypothetical protein
MLSTLKNPYTYVTCYFIKLCQIVVTLVRCFSYPLDQDHIHSTSIAKFLHRELACSIHPPNKYSMCYVICLQVCGRTNPLELFQLKCASHNYTGDTNSMHFKRNNPLICRVTARFNHGYTGSR